MISELLPNQQSTDTAKSSTPCSGDRTVGVERYRLASQMEMYEFDDVLAAEATPAFAEMAADTRSGQKLLHILELATRPKRSGNRVPAALTRAIDNLALAKEEASAVPMAVNLVADRPQSKSANVEHRLLYYRCESCSASGRRRPRRPFPDRRPSRHDGRSDRTSALATSLEAFPAPANGSRRSAFLCRNHRCLSVAMRSASSHVCN